MSKTKIVTPKVRVSFVNILKPKAFEGSDDAKYSLHILIPKKDKALVEKVKDAIDAAIKEGIQSKWDGKQPKKMWNPLQDGDDKADEYPEYEGMYFINAKTSTKPGIVDSELNEILDGSEIYSGMYARVSVNFYPFKAAGNTGIAAGLNNVQKVADGDMLGGGRASAEDDFGSDDDDDFLG